MKAATSSSFIDFLREQLAPLGPIAPRRMFGVTALFCDGAMFGLVAEDTFYVRVDDGNRAALKEAEAFPPYAYEKQGSMVDLSFWRVPDRLFDEPDELVAWARLALAAAHRIAARRAGATSRRKPRSPGRG